MNQVVLNRDGITIQGEKTVLLCASLFYFRIPRAEWEDRITKLKAAGYNCADVYFPWNNHETTPGKWDFDGEKDVSEFLGLLKQHGLYVIARPGPYICSEWDGGAIPAWILTDRSLHIRQYDPGYLAAVRRWYEKILPRIAEYQIDRGGTVVLVQLENELDFYDCQNPRAYMSALRDLAQEMDITVPLTGCAGQSNVEGATGWADGINISFNFYGDPCDVTYGEKFHYYTRCMRDVNRPLMITETNCDHLLLRRELAAGAKLLGPYNQVGGTNFGLTGSINNWGERERPISFITTYYSMDNMVGPAGELNRQYFEGRRFAGLINTFGASLGGAESVENKALSIACDFVTNSTFYRLALKGGGSLICVPNLSEQSGKATINDEGTTFETTVPGHSAPFFPCNIPLSIFGREGMLICANGELENCVKTGGELVFTFWTESDTPFARFDVDGKSVTLTREHSSCSGIRIILANEQELRNKPLAGAQLPQHTEYSKRVQVGSLGQVHLSDDLRSHLPYRTEPVQALERYGIYRGGGAYRFSVAGQGILLIGPSDIVSVYRNNQFEAAFASAGSTRYHPGDGQYEIITTIWGHSNFADARQPSLMMDSAKGLLKAVEVRHIQELGSNWFFSYYEGELPDSLRVPQRLAETLLSINEWNTTRTPLRATYRKQVQLDPHADSFVIEMRNSEAEAVLYVDGIRVKLVNPQDPFIDISEFVHGKEATELAFCVTKRDWNEPVGIPVLYSGDELKMCEFAKLTQENLTAGSGACGEAYELPLALEAGEILNVCLSLEGIPSSSCYLHVEGSNIYAVALVGDRVLGRILLWETSPRMAGNANILYLPQSYSAGQKEFRLLVTALGEHAELSAVNVESVM